MSVPATAEAGADLDFGNSAAALAGLSFSWNFGDGSSSTEARPRHSFRLAGTYDVVLKVTNAAGQSRDLHGSVTVSAMGNVHGLACSGANDGGWCGQQQPPAFSRVKYLTMLDASTGWLVDEYGQIRKTVDGGRNWTVQYAGVSAQGSATGFAATFAPRSKTEVWALTNDGTGFALRSTDAGSTWLRTTLPGDWSYAMHFSGEHGVVTERKTVQHWLNGSADDGATFVARQIGYDNPPYDTPWNVATFLPSGAVWVAEDGAVKRAADPGLNFVRVFSVPADPISPVTTTYLSVMDDQHALLSVNYVRRSYWTGNRHDEILKHVLWRSDDGGATWSNADVDGQFSAGPSVLRASPQDAVVLATASLYGDPNPALLRSADRGRSWVKVAGAPRLETVIDLDGRNFAGIQRDISGDLLWVSPDAGLTWQSGTRLDDEASISRIDANTLLMETLYPYSSQEGWLLRSYRISADRGLSWRDLAGQPGGAKALQSAPWFFDAKRGVMSGYDAELRDTTDGGRTWTLRSPGQPASTAGPQVAPRIQFVDASTGWRLRSTGVLDASTDGGLTWKPLPGAPVSDFHFADKLRGWIKPADAAKPMLLTTDGGLTFTDTGVPIEIQSLRFGPDGRIVGVGSRLMVFSTDSGKTWQRRPRESDFKQLAFQGSVIWAVGYAVERSVDGGNTWTRLDLTFPGLPINDIAFANNGNDGWMVGAGGGILATRDGGATWTRQDSGTSYNLVKLQFADARTGWVTDERGQVIVTATGGN